MSHIISAPVGPRKSNAPSDVKTVQALLNRSSIFKGRSKALVEDGKFGPATEAAILTFQRLVIGRPSPDGTVSRSGTTIRMLSRHVGPARVANPKSGNNARKELSESDFIDAARALGCEVPAIKAVASTETKRNAFDAEGRPTILFERHYFHKLTEGRFDKSHPTISNKVAGGYGKFAEQRGKLEEAKKIDETAALKSASWGAFQIMGANYKQAGYASVNDFVNAMGVSQRNHLEAFVNYVGNDPALKKALQQKDWAVFARIYNGPRFKQNNYDTVMKQNYEYERKNETRNTIPIL